MYARETRHISHDDEDLIVIVMHSVLAHNVPEKKSAIRVDDYHQSLAMKKAGDHGTQGRKFFENNKNYILRKLFKVLVKKLFVFVLENSLEPNENNFLFKGSWSLLKSYEHKVKMFQISITFNINN